MDPYQIILRPVITEKSTFLKEKNREVCFEVASGANKAEIKKAESTCSRSRSKASGPREGMAKKGVWAAASGRRKTGKEHWFVSKKAKK